MRGGQWAVGNSEAIEALTQSAKILSSPRISLITTQLSLCWALSWFQVLCANSSHCLAGLEVHQAPLLFSFWPPDSPTESPGLHRQDRFTSASELNTSRGHHSHCNLCPTLAHRHAGLPHLPFACSYEPPEVCPFPEVWSCRRNFRAHGGCGGGFFDWARLPEAAR